MKKKVNYVLFIKIFKSSNNAAKFDLNIGTNIKKIYIKAKRLVEFLLHELQSFVESH